MRRKNEMGIGGIEIGLVGEEMVEMKRGEVGKKKDIMWIEEEIMIKVILDIGNIYRKMEWKKK